MKRFLGWTVAALAVAALAYAGWRVVGGSRSPSPDKAPAATAPKAPPVVELVESDILTVSKVPLARTLEVSGSVRAVDSAFVKARVAAELRRVTVREGDAVKAGQVVAEQDTTELDLRLRQAEQQALAARAQVEIAQRTLANNRALVAQGFISPTALETSISTEAGAQASLQAAQAAVDLARKARADAVLTAPISGYVSQRLAQPGERVALDARVLEIVNLSRLEMEVAVPPEDAGSIRVGQTARVRVEGLTEEVKARVARLNPSAQPGSRAVSVYLDLEPRAGLRHGLFGRGTVVLEQREALSLPPSAVRRDRPAPYVLRLEGDLVQERNVRLGITGLAASAGDGERLEITEGLAAGDRVLAGTAGALPAGTLWKPSTAATSAGASPGGSPGANPATASPARPASAASR